MAETTRIPGLDEKLSLKNDDYFIIFSVSDDYTYRMKSGNAAKFLSSFKGEWSAQTYESNNFNPDVFVVGEVEGVKGLYQLAVPTPYASVTFAEEVTAGDWELISGGGEGADLTNYYTKAETDGFLIQKAGVNHGHVIATPVNSGFMSAQQAQDLASLLGASTNPTASNVVFVPFGDVTSTNVQAAIEEVRALIETSGHTHPNQLTVLDLLSIVEGRLALDGDKYALFSDIPAPTPFASNAETIAGVVDNKAVAPTGLAAWWTDKLDTAITFLKKITFTVAPRFSSTTASQILEVDANKDLISVAKKTGYNLDIGTTSNTLAAGNDSRFHTHPDQETLDKYGKDGSENPTYDGDRLAKHSELNEDQNASEVPFTPYEDVTAENVQVAIQQLKDLLDLIETHTHVNKASVLDLLSVITGRLAFNGEEYAKLSDIGAGDPAPPATETTAGIQEVATLAEMIAEALDNKTASPFKLGGWWSDKLTKAWTWIGKQTFNAAPNFGFTTSTTGGRIVEVDVNKDVKTVAKKAGYNNDYGTAAGTVAQGNDSRFHSHPDLAALNKFGEDEDLPTFDSERLALLSEIPDVAGIKTDAHRRIFPNPNNLVVGDPAGLNSSGEIVTCPMTVPDGVEYVGIVESINGGNATVNGGGWINLTGLGKDANSVYYLTEEGGLSTVRPSSYIKPVLYTFSAELGFVVHLWALKGSVGFRKVVKVAATNTIDFTTDKIYGSPSSRVSGQLIIDDEGAQDIMQKIYYSGPVSIDNSIPVYNNEQDAGNLSSPGPKVLWITKSANEYDLAVSFPTLINP